MIKNPQARAETARMGVYTAIAGAVAAGFTYLAPHNSGGEAPNTAALEAKLVRYEATIMEMRQDVANMRLELKADVRNYATASRQSNAELRQWVQMVATVGASNFSSPPPPAPAGAMAPVLFSAPVEDDVVFDAMEAAEDDPPE